ncbi:hypothetical protein CJ030_MR7G009305 [Morella rubra]|uniref:Uncharacterized protein n=1 Tax=Morella rubra TaxID=262757 RepID=A0A6A1V1A6_9ROSI|nr:hypothetical protein CJ030_MR7G009305 [Morella rubra]
MSSGRSKRTTRETPSSVSSRARKRISGNEEPVDAPKPSIYRSRLCKNKFVQYFRNRKVIAGCWVDFLGSVRVGSILRRCLTFKADGFVQNDDGDWVKMGVVITKKRGSDSEDGEEADTERTPRGNRTPLGEQTPISTPPLLIASSSRIPDASSHEPCLSELEASMAELKEEQKKMTASMQAGFEDIKKLLAVHPERFGTLDKDMRGLKPLVNNNIHMASTVIQNTVDDFKATLFYASNTYEEVSCGCCSSHRGAYER